ncbi:MAG: hypothetical protein GC205_00035 [Bacteroidetes bacterium]|nr:hypothetical protein [Bacteroidota bacterium]
MEDLNLKKAAAGNFPLSSYATVAGAFLASSSPALADINFVEVNQSLMLDDLSIDFDGDGVFDANVLQTNYYSNQVGGFDGLGNAFVGSGLTSGFLYPSALASGILVGAGASAVPNLVVGYGLVPWASLNYGSSFGQWIPASAGDTVDAYIGMEFLAGDGNTYNAWIRCKIARDSEVIVVSYAWEDSPGVPIATGDTGPLGVLADPATALLAADISDNGNGSDLELRFARAADETTIGSYRAIAVPAAASASFTLGAAETLPADRYISVAPTGADPIITFGAGGRDADGVLIAPGTAYQCFVLSVADGTAATLNQLSDASNEVTLLASASPARNPEASDVGNEGNGSDLRVVFDNALDESTLSEYRILVVDSAQVSSFDLAAAEAVVAGNFTARPPLGGVQNVLLTATSRTAAGNLIENEAPYRIFVLSVANGSNAQLNSLSEASNAITLRMVTGLSAPASQTALTATLSQGTLQVEASGLSGLSGTLELFQVDGRLVANWPFDGQRAVFTGIPVQPGMVYLLSWNTEFGRVNQRLSAQSL